MRSRHDRGYPRHEAGQVTGHGSACAETQETSKTLQGRRVPAEFAQDAGTHQPETELHPSGSTLGREALAVFEALQCLGLLDEFRIQVRPFLRSEALA